MERESGGGQGEDLEHVKAGPGELQAVSGLDRRYHGQVNDQEGNQGDREDSERDRQPADMRGLRAFP